MSDSIRPESKKKLTYINVQSETLCKVDKH